MLVWIEFLLVTGLILFSGSRLSRYGDMIAEKTGLSRLWLGLVLMAAVTSLPELATGLSSVAFAGLPNVAAGDILGSCVFNMFLLSLLDALSGKVPLASRTHQGSLLTAGIFLLLVSAVGVGLFAGDRLPGLGWIGLYTPVLLFGYLGAMRLAFRYEKRGAAAPGTRGTGEPLYRSVTLKRAVLGYVVNAALVVGAAIFLPRIAEGIARLTGLGTTFVGNVFVAMSTSLPELTVTIASFRLGAIDTAVGNLFGSNLFNMAILGLDDLFYFKSPLLAAVEKQHIVPALSAVAMTGLAVAGLIYRSSKKRSVLSWDSAGILLVFVVNMILLYVLR
ncbi:MAG TPA: sodium:calcium antiporter [Acidobacteriota bacterium]|nr:sodium:calcium antiporter [Acidobacteriota bacterium]